MEYVFGLRIGYKTAQIYCALIQFACEMMCKAIASGSVFSYSTSAPKWIQIKSCEWYTEAEATCLHSHSNAIVSKTIHVVSDSIQSSFAFRHVYIN